MNTATATLRIAGRDYTLADNDGKIVLVNSRNRVTARVSFNSKGQILMITAGTGILPGGWSERDWNSACDQIEALAR